MRHDKTAAEQLLCGRPGPACTPAWKAGSRGFRALSSSCHSHRRRRSAGRAAAGPCCWAAGKSSMPPADSNSVMYSSASSPTSGPVSCQSSDMSTSSTYAAPSSSSSLSSLSSKLCVITAHACFSVLRKNQDAADSALPAKGCENGPSIQVPSTDDPPAKAPGPSALVWVTIGLHGQLRGLLTST